MINCQLMNCFKANTHCRTHTHTKKEMETHAHMNAHQVIL
jgi:hypothetical protein